ncbi:unnamed protein product [Prunus armeniaca]|uniref:Uncharacterized protein n=1 Tax=Prunus armeniaca TaxID=36596 RepID=A0A6J5V6W1_PRUAR|nr:unnamed protein product [Prunus armeniaca]
MAGLGSWAIRSWGPWQSCSGTNLGLGRCKSRRSWAFLVTWFLLAGPIRAGSFGVWSWAFLVTWVSRSNHGSSVCQGKSWVLTFGRFKKTGVWAHEDLGPALG